MQSYRLETWRITSLNERRLVMRPTGRTLLNRFAITLVCIILMACIAYPLYKTPRPGSTTLSSDVQAERQRLEEITRANTQNMIDQGLITQEEVDAIYERSRQRTAEAREENTEVYVWGRNLIYAGIAFFGFFALLAPISVLWERVTAGIDMRGEFFVRRRDSIGWKSISLFPRGTLHTLRVHAREHQEGSRKSGYRTVGWMWEVTMQGQDPRNGILLSVDLNPHRPLENSRLPEKVNTIATALATFSGSALQTGHAVLDLDSTRKRYTTL